MTALRVAAFELRQQLRGHVFWVVFAISSIMVAGSLWVDELRVGPAGGGLRNGADAVARTHLLWSLFFMFTAAAFAADAALRDRASGFAPIVDATPARAADLRLGRLAGSFAAVAICFLSVPAALAAGSLAPWIEPGSTGPFRPSAYVFAFVVLALPNLFLMSGAFFGLATATRSLPAAMLGAVALLVLYGLGGEAGGTVLPALLEPFGFAAYADTVEAWSPEARDVCPPAPGGALLLNRLLWIGVGAGLAAAALFVPPWPARPAARPREAADDRPVGARRDVSPRFTARTTLSQFAARMRLEVGQIVASPVFAVLLLLGTANAAAALRGLPAPTTGAAVEALIEAFRLLPTVVALFFAGELLWNERERRVHALVGASPMPDAAFVLPKLLALVLVLAALALAGGAAGAVAQVVRGQAPDVGAYLRLFVVPAAYDWSLVAALALFFQALAPNKLAGWGYMILYLVASLALQRLGYDDPLYRYGRYPGWPLPPALSGADGADVHRAYWGAAAVALTVLAFGLVGRGAGDALGVRLRRLPDRLRGPAGVVGLAAAAAFVGLGAALAADR